MNTTTTTPRTKTHTQPGPSPARRALTALAALSLTLLTPACGGKSGGGTGSGASGTSGALGAFGSAGQVLSIDPATTTTRVEAPGAGGYHSVYALARDSARDLFYAIDSDRNLLLRIDAGGGVARVGPLSAGVGPVVFDPDTGDLIGIQNGGRLRPTKLVRIDPQTAEVTVVANTSRANTITLDRAMGRLLAIAGGSTAQTNTLIAIDLQTGATTTLYDDPSFSSAAGLSFDPVTRTLYAATNADPGSVYAYDPLSPGVLAVTSYERVFQDLVLDTDSGRQFGLGTGGEIFELTNPSGSSQGGVATPLVTLGRELRGLTFDPADGRFFAIDTPNHELVKFDPTTGLMTRVARLSLRAGFHRSVNTLAYDPMRGRLFGVDRYHSELLSIDPVTGEAVALAISLGTETILAMDPMSGRLFAYDPRVEVLLEIDPDLETWFILDNAIGLTDVEDLTWDPLTQRLLALHRTAGRSGVPKLSSILLQGTASPMPHSDVPFGLSALGRDARTGLFHAFGAGRPRMEMELDLSKGSSYFQRIRSVDGAWVTGLRAALTVPSLGIVFVIDNERLYEYDPRTRRMLLKGSLPDSSNIEDLIYDPAAGFLGLRDADEVTWVNPSIPFSPKGRTSAPARRDMRITCDAGGHVYGVADGVLYEVTLGSTATLRALTPSARSGFTVESVTYSPGQGAVFATGTDTATQTRVLVRFDATTGEWTDQGTVSEPVGATFLY